MFRSAMAYRVPEDYRFPDEERRAELLATIPAKEPTGLALEAIGFGPLVNDVLTLGDARAGHVVLEQASRMLPKSVIRRAVADRCKEFEEKTGRKPGKRMRREFEEAVLNELVPRAFVRVARTNAYWDEAARLVVVEATSDSAAERVLRALREAFGSLPVRPLACEASVSLVLTEWLVSGTLPEGFSLGDAVVLKDPSDQSSTVRAAHVDLSTDEVCAHARTGRAVTQLALIYRDRISFVLDSRLRLKSISFLGIDEETASEAEEDVVTLLDGSLRICRGEMRELYAGLDRVFRFVE